MKYRTKKILIKSIKKINRDLKKIKDPLIKMALDIDLMNEVNALNKLYKKKPIKKPVVVDINFDESSRETTSYKSEVLLNIEDLVDVDYTKPWLGLQPTNEIDEEKFGDDIDYTENVGLSDINN